MAQLYKNLAKTTLGADLNTGVTSCTFADGSVFDAPTGGDNQILFLLDNEYNPTQYEIVSMTARSGNTGTIVRAQEGTSQPASWPAGTVVAHRLSAGTIAKLLANGTTQTDSLALLGATISSTDDVGIGLNVIIDQPQSVGIARAVEIYSQRCVGLGAFAYIDASSQESVASGYQAFIGSSSPQSVAVGDAASVGNTSPHGIAVGKSANIAGGVTDGLACGNAADVSANYAGALGPSADANIAGTLHISMAPIVAKHNATMDDGAESFRYYSAPKIVLSGQTIDLTQVAADDIQTITIPTGAHFYPDEVQIIIETSDTVTVDPAVAVGTTTGGTELLGSTTITDTNARERTINTAVSRHGVTGNILVSLKTAATATALTGRVLITGILVENS